MCSCVARALCVCGGGGEGTHAVLGRHHLLLGRLHHRHRLTDAVAHLVAVLDFVELLRQQAHGAPQVEHAARAAVGGVADVVLFAQPAAVAVEPARERDGQERRDHAASHAVVVARCGGNVARGLDKKCVCGGGERCGCGKGRGGCGKGRGGGAGGGRAGKMFSTHAGHAKPRVTACAGPVSKAVGALMVPVGGRGALLVEGKDSEKGVEDSEKGCEKEGRILCFVMV
jgi:hypothetical protein